MENPYFSEDGFFGQMSDDFAYNPANEMSFGFPEEGTAQIYLEMPDDKSGYYEIYLVINETANLNDLDYSDFYFRYTDARLLDDFSTSVSTVVLRLGAPIIQRGRLVGVYSSILVWNEDNVWYSANFAADMRFAMLQEYDASFDAELFRNVPTLRGYFD
jgi:hypothetical protein